MTQNRRAITYVAAASTHLSIAVFGLALFILGCASGATRKTSSVQARPNVKTSAAELSARNQSLLEIYSAEIELAADQIISESPSPVARRQALVWKIDAIPVLQRSMLNTDPVVATVDTWAYIFQMKEYMERPAIQQSFAGMYPVVTAALTSMDGEMQRLIQIAAPSANLTEVRQAVASWAHAHPVHPGLAGRQSMAAEQIREVGDLKLGARASIATLAESLGDFTDRLDSYNAYLPKQARWQAELMLSDLARAPEFSSALSNTAVLADALAKTSNSVERMPDLVDHTRAAVMSDVDRQRLAAQDFLQAERQQVFDTLARERAALTADINRQRTAATTDLHAEVQTGLKALHDERVGAMDDARAAAATALQDFDSRARSLMNRFFIYGAVFMLVTVALCSLAAWLLLRRFGKRPDRGQVLYDRAA